MKTWKALALSLSLIAPFSAQPAQAATSSTPAFGMESSDAAPVMNQCDFRLELRKIFADHISWGRLATISEVNKLPDKDAAMQRLLKTGQDLAEVFKRYYGAQTGKQLNDLFLSHIQLAVKVVQARNSGDINGLKAANQLWVANAESIAHALAALNPHWPESELKSMMREHLRLESRQVGDYIDRKYSESAADHEASLRHALKMADTIALGIIQQFPGSFR